MRQTCEHKQICVINYIYFIKNSLKLHQREEILQINS